MQRLLKKTINFLRDPSLIIRHLFQFQSAINQAASLIKRADHSAAAEILKNIIRRQPCNLRAQIMLARAAVALRDYAAAGQAVDSFIQCAAGAKNISHSLILRAVDLLRQIGREEECRDIILRLAPPRRHRDSYLALASCARQNLPEWERLVNHYLAGFHLSPIAASWQSHPLRIVVSAVGRSLIDTQPLVSVIMSAYNMAGYIRGAVRSILSQTWRNLELWVVDDCSSDSTADLVRQIAAADPRVRLIRLPVNVGTYVCRNIAFERCAGQFVAIQDADDWCHPDRIRIQIEDMLAHPGRIANFTWFVRVTEDGLFELRSRDNYTSQVCMPSLLVHKAKVLQNLGYWDSVRVSSDSEFLERLYKIFPFNAVRIIPKTLVFQLRRSGSLTMQPETMSLDEYKSPPRRDYKLSFREWHQNIKKNNCKIPFPLQERPFHAPEQISVPCQDVIKALNGITIESFD